jgi:membrane protein implicated in regulation of membrane protease activity
MLIYAAIGAFGLLFLLVMLFVGDLFGGDHDLHVGDMGGHDISGHGAHEGAGEGGPSIFSARIMASFVAAFGFGGAIARFMGFSHPASSGLGIVAGAVIGGLVFQFARILYGQQASSEVKMTTLVGMTGEVAIAIPKGGVGQITITAAGEVSTHIARSKDGRAIPQGTAVTIRETRGDSVVVEPA